MLDHESSVNKLDKHLFNRNETSPHLPYDKIRDKDVNSMSPNPSLHWLRFHQTTLNARAIISIFSIPSAKEILLSNSLLFYHMYNIYEKSIAKHENRKLKHDFRNPAIS